MNAAFSGEVHPFAESYRLLDGEELQMLADDIAANGVQVNPTIDARGRLIAGRNRLAACEIAGVVPTFDVLDTDDDDVILAFIRSENGRRRHDSTGQRAMSEAVMLAKAGKRVDGRWKRGSLVDTSESGSKQWAQRMAEAGVVLDHAPGLAEAVIAGRSALDAAFREAETRRDAERQAAAEIERMQAEEAEARARLVELAPAYMTALDNGEYKSARQAFVAWEQANLAAAAKERQEKAARLAEEKRRRADLTQTYTSMAEGLLSVGSHAHADIEKVMADFDPSLLNPPQLIRYFDVANLRAGIAFLNDLIEWKEAHDA